MNTDLGVGLGLGFLSIITMSIDNVYFSIAKLIIVYLFKKYSLELHQGKNGLGQNLHQICELIKILTVSSLLLSCRRNLREEYWGSQGYAR